jgi:anti-sigma factor RsiW
MTPCEPFLLSAYVDSEVDVATRQRVETHVAACVTCAAELAELRELSRSLASYELSDPLTRDDLARVHDALDDAAEATVWRIGGPLGLIAASILVVSATWLMTLPKPQPAGGVDSGTQATIVRNFRPMEPWERAAVQLRVPSQAEYNEPTYAQAFSDFMVDSLKPAADSGEGSNQ